MADLVTMAHFDSLSARGHLPSIGAWVQVDPDRELTTVLNAFNTLGKQTTELWLLDQEGSGVANRTVTIETNHTLRLDPETMLDPSDLPFEGSIWVWSLGAEASEGNLGLQAIDLDFVDRARPDGYTAASVHIIFDFINTLSMGPWLELISPKVVAERTHEGSDRYLNYIGMAHIVLHTDGGLPRRPRLLLTLYNDQGDSRVSDPIVLEPHGSFFGALEFVFPGMHEFLATDSSHGQGIVEITAADGEIEGMAAMIKVVDQLSGEMMVSHLNDRNFARPALKEP